MSSRLIRSCVPLSVLLCSLLLWQSSAAAVRQSSNYQIESDSINVGGGYGSSTSYVLEDTTGEQATGPSESTSYKLRAGYQQMQEVYLAITGVAADVTMSPSIGGVTGGTSTGETTLTVTTDNRAGYQMYIAASTDPALQSASSSIADYVPVGSDPDYDFSTGSTDSHFGFSPEGVDITDRFKDDTAACGTGGSVDTANKCWDGLSTTDALIVERLSANHPDGSTTTIKFQVGVGGAVNQPIGTYTATTTVTVLPL